MTSLVSVLSALFSLGFMLVPQQESLRLNITEYVVSDTAKYESFRLKVINESDSIVYIEQAQPSCGCVLVTVQRALATKDQPGDIYVAVTVEKMSVDQPITIDVHTNRNRSTPLRLYIRKHPPAKAPAGNDSLHSRVEPSPNPRDTIPAKKRWSPRKRHPR